MEFNMKTSRLLMLMCLIAFSAMTGCANPNKKQKPKPLEYCFNMVHHNPGEPLFVTKYVRADYLKQIGYNGDNPRIYIQCAITYDKFEPGIVPYESATWAWIQRCANNLDHIVQEHEEAGLAMYPFTDVLVVPKEVMDKYGNQMKDDNGELSIRKPMTQKIIRAQIEEIFRRFPQVDGLTTRFGETYLTDTPFHRGNRPVQTMDDHVLLINILREEICVKRNKKLFYRTWDFGDLHTNPENYLKVTDQVEPHPNLIFMIKHSNNDFVRNVPRNVTLGLGKHRQIVEISLMQAGCYGKGAYPYYIGKGVLHGWNELGPDQGIDQLAKDGKIAGVFIWPRGDSWSGPYLSSEFWPDLNGYIFREFAKRPWLNDQQLFDEYCKKELKLTKADTEKLYELCLLSADATFTGAQSDIIHIRPWWQRDDKLTDIFKLGWWKTSERMIKLDPKDVDHKALLEEKAKSVADWRKIEKLSRQINIPNPEDQKYLEVSSTYGRIYFSIIEQIWKLSILDLNEGDNANIEQVQKIINEYDRLWNQWFKLECENPSCATLYMTCWPQTYPPKWREAPDTKHTKLHHDTPIISKWRKRLPK